MYAAATDEFVMPANKWWPRDHQIAAVELPAERRRPRGGDLAPPRRQGRDLPAPRAMSALRRVGNYWHALPEYNQCRKAIWTAINAHTGREGSTRRFRPRSVPTPSTTKCSSGCTMVQPWQCIGSDRYDAALGAGPAGITYSEYALRTRARGPITGRCCKKTRDGRFLLPPRAATTTLNRSSSMRSAPRAGSPRCSPLSRPAR